MNFIVMMLCDSTILNIVNEGYQLYFLMFIVCAFIM
ncbi:Uncharacterised protein [Serratia fonticola]|nr:Uncharacterised protein [Serratia fonticola]